MPSEFHNREPPLPFGNPKSRLWYGMDIFWNRPLTENLLEFNGNNYRQTHGVALGIETAVSFANIYKAETETNLIQHRNTNENVSLMTFPFFGTVTEKTQLFIKETNKSHPKN